MNKSGKWWPFGKKENPKKKTKTVKEAVEDPVAKKVLVEVEADISQNVTTLVAEFQALLHNQRHSHEDAINQTHTSYEYVNASTNVKLPQRYGNRIPSGMTAFRDKCITLVYRKVESKAGMKTYKVTEQYGGYGEWGFRDKKRKYAGKSKRGVNGYFYIYIVPCMKSGRKLYLFWRTEGESQSAASTGVVGKIKQEERLKKVEAYFPKMIRYS